MLRLFLVGAAILMLGPVPARAVEQVDPARYVVETVAGGLDRPWAVAPLPDGRTLLTEAPGRLKIVDAAGGVTPVSVAGLPPIHTGGQGGLMDVAVDPDFAASSLVFLTMIYGTDDANNARLVRARLAGDRLEDVRVLFDATPKAGNSNNGARIAFLPDRTMILTLGDGFDRREDAQDLSNHLGKLVRLDRDGNAPADNPFVGRAGAAPEIYSLGHRNVQGVVVDPDDGVILASEHGPRGGDEINRLRAGGNYGWPVVTGGLDYTFARVTPFRDLPGYEQPLLEWTPSIAPAGLALYDGALFPEWRGALLVPALKERAVRVVRRANGRIVGEELLLGERGDRMRDVAVAPDGSILVLTDGENAALLRVAPR
ncbi:PQQ-dependent sugar dehydrogenase [Methylopila henanensis]|uniref:PQQ-dependent sugar dehydrogenase n=1 Tax=Methylopila henanensis TaxID=873516 RepID=A0ABW4K014_9HYPH